MRFISVGEALIDLVRQPGGSPAATPWLGLSAGGPVNTAIGLARLGLDTGMLTRFGSDGFAGQLAQHLAGNGVNLDLCPHAEAPTTLAVVSLDDTGHATYAFHFGGTSSFGWTAAELPAPRPDTWLHLASIAWVVEPGAGVLKAWLAGAAAGWAGVSYDINVRPTVIAAPDEYWAAIAPVLAAVGAAGGIIKASDEDLAFLARAGACPSGDGTAEGIAQALLAAFGPRAVVVTQGGDGAFAVSAEGLAKVPGLKVEVVDTVGAGDTFTAGFLEQFTGGASLEASLQRGTVAAAIVCGRQGADPPTKEEVDAYEA